MKKILIPIIILLILIGIWFVIKKAPAPQENNTPPTQSLSDATPPTPEKSTVINSIKDAMGMGTKMECTYALGTDANTTSTIFVDGQKIKTATSVSGMTMYGIFDGDTQYTWTEGSTTQGFKMSKSCMDEMKNLAPQKAQGNVPTPAPVQDYQSYDKAQNVSCKAATEDVDFSIPSDITFVDQCEMMRDSMKAMEQMKQQLPSGMKMPTQH